MTQLGHHIGDHARDDEYPGLTQPNLENPQFNRKDLVSRHASPRRRRAGRLLASLSVAAAREAVTLACEL